MCRLFFLIIFTLKLTFPQSLYNGVGHIPISNQVEWFKAGLLPETPIYANNIYNVCDYGAIPNDGIDDFQSIEAALNAASNSTGINIVYFPAGTFKINSTINLTTANSRDNIVIQGSGSNSTILEFSVGSASRCFNIGGTFSSVYSVNYSLTKGSNEDKCE